MNRSDRLDRLIYKDIAKITDGDTMVLSYDGFSDLEVEQRLKHLAAKGVIGITEAVGQTAVTSITQAGHDFFNSISVE